MDALECIKRRIEETIARSRVPEDPLHARNTLEWLLKLKLDADLALQIAALGHDIERAMEERKVRRENFSDYEEFKKAHALNSARILKEIMEECGADEDLINDVVDLVKKHEWGGDERAGLLMIADTLSFFEVNLPLYFQRNSLEETKRRFLWGYRKLPEELKRVVKKFRYKDEKLNRLVREWVEGEDSVDSRRETENGNS